MKKIIATASLATIAAAFAADVINGIAQPEYSYEHDYIVHKVTLEAAGIL